MRNVIAEALSRPPCGVSFSGGRDSSAILALATDVARNEGLELPIPITHRFPRSPATDETAWQDTVIRHLELTDWERHEFVDDELDLLGPVAQSVLRRHGLLWPSNAHFHEPILARLAGGSLLTGKFGDELFYWRWARAAAVWWGKDRPVPRDATRIALMFAPRAVRVALGRLRAGSAMPWLRPEARREFHRALALEEDGLPRRWDHAVDRLARSRYRTSADSSFQLLAGEHDVLLTHPFEERRVLAALARAGGRAGFGYRTSALLALFGDLLPADVLIRRSKTEFNGVFRCRYSVEFARTWSGGGVPSEVVDEDALRDAWLGEPFHFGSSLALQAAWLASKTTVDNSPRGAIGS
jgi:asparagine synthase (glutamine-hydrolysing)